MKEDFLHYVWKYQKFTTTEFFTVAGEIVRVIHPGHHNTDAGPDFLNAQLVIDNQLWAGNIEIHLKSSDWYAHKHQDNPSYDSVLLHVVWHYNVAVFRENDDSIPTIAVKNLVMPSAIKGYESLLSGSAHFINCEKNFASVDHFTVNNWLERLFIERLENKTTRFQKELGHSKNHWEALLFRQLCATFGLKVNCASFSSIAQSFPFSVVQKSRGNLHAMEALFFGQAGLLDTTIQNVYVRQLQQEYHYLKIKFKLSNDTVIAPKFFRLRPPNFPTLRLSQLAVLYANSEHLFSKLIDCTSKEECYSIFNITATKYWDTHYNFGATSSEREKTLTTKFIDLVLLNAVIPIAFCYAKEEGNEISEDIVQLAASISSEQNTIVKQFNSLRKCAHNAMQSQALLQLKQEYCTVNRCLDCAVGNALLCAKE